MNIKSYNSKIKYFGKSKTSKFILILLSIILVILIALYFNYDRVSADDSSNRKKEFVSIKIEQGDTLWDIAKEYISEEYNDINEYIEEIKASNGLYEDTIHEGRFLIVPYYASEDLVDNLEYSDIKSANNFK